MTLIYCIEDDQSIRELVVYALKSSGFEARGFEDGKVDFGQADLVLLDIMLPGDDGITILRKIRSSAETQDLPVIMLTAKTGELDKVRALDLGADDYIDKPFSIMELVSRVKALLRRTKNEPKLLKYKTISLSKDQHRVWVGEEDIQLTNKEFGLLEYFLTNPGLVLSRDQILQEVWGFDFEGETRTIDVHIRSLRLKLKSAGQEIKTIINVGYRLGD